MDQAVPRGHRDRPTKDIDHLGLRDDQGSLPLTFGGGKRQDGEYARSPGGRIVSTDFEGNRSRNRGRGNRQDRTVGSSREKNRRVARCRRRVALD